MLYLPAAAASLSASAALSQLSPVNDTKLVPDVSNTGFLLPFRYYLRVRYGECDAQRVVFPARYADYVDVAVKEFIRALGFGTELCRGELDFQVLRQSIEWKYASRYDDVIECRVAAHRVSSTSFILNVEFRTAGDDVVRANAETSYVLIDTSFGIRLLPEPFRAALQHGANGHITDHAAWFIQRAS